MRKLLRTMFSCLLGLNMSAAVIVHNAVAQDATAYRKACGACHPAPAAIARKIRGKTEDERKANLMALLTRHHTPDPAEIDQIVAYLLAVPQK